MRLLTVQQTLSNGDRNGYVRVTGKSGRNRIYKITNKGKQVLNGKLSKVYKKKEPVATIRQNVEVVAVDNSPKMLDGGIRHCESCGNEPTPSVTFSMGEGAKISTICGTCSRARPVEVYEFEAWLEGMLELITRPG
jgi:ubiquinone/menaquinone biosynthesis C-methylase UbiE